MGNIADMMLDGTLDEQTGEYIDGKSPGYPRTMEEEYFTKRKHFNTIKHVRTQDVRVGKKYLYKGKTVTILEKVRGTETNQRNMHSGILFTGYKRTQKRFILSDGNIVKADKLFYI